MGGQTRVAPVNLVLAALGLVVAVMQMLSVGDPRLGACESEDNIGVLVVDNGGDSAGEVAGYEGPGSWEGAEEELRGLCAESGWVSGGHVPAAMKALPPEGVTLEPEAVAAAAWHGTARMAVKDSCPDTIVVSRGARADHDSGRGVAAIWAEFLEGMGPAGRVNTSVRLGFAAHGDEASDACFRSFTSKGRSWPVLYSAEHLQRAMAGHFDRIQERADAVAWMDKRQIVAWRGAISKPAPEAAAWAATATESNATEVEEEYNRLRMATDVRYRLVNISFALRTFDARITGPTSEYDLAVEEALDLVPFSARFHVPSSAPDLLSYYRHVIVVNGGAGSLHTLEEHLAAAQTVLLQESAQQPWFAELLAPWFHFIPVDESLSDIQERVAWVYAHPLHARRIALNGRRFFEQVLRLDAAKAVTRSILASAAARPEAPIPAGE